MLSGRLGIWPAMPESDYWYCPVEGCEYWAALSGYTEKVIRHMKTHIANEHDELPGSARRRDGGIVDAEIAKAILASRRDA
jgi:hypothetical protein